MRLVSVDGAIVDLRPMGYQFPDVSGSADVPGDWDANWLLVRGEVGTADGRWSSCNADPRGGRVSVKPGAFRVRWHMDYSV